MKALVSKEAGGPETLEYCAMPDPSALDHQLLIAVKACGLNFPDLLLIQDLYQVKAPRPFIPGAEVGGVVVDVGTSAGEFRPGDRVMARCGTGGLGELIAIDASRCAKIPDSMSMEHAAAFQFAYETSYHALIDRGRIQAGDQVLVLGASGGLGIAAIQIAKAKGARVFAMTSSQEKLSFATENGADDGLIYPSDLASTDLKTLTKDVKRLLGPKGADIVFDPVGGPLAEIALRSSGEKSRYLVLGFTAGIPSIPLNLPLLKSSEILGVNWRTFSMEEPGANAANRDTLLQMYERDEIRPPVTVTYPLQDGAEALQLFSERTILGKVVVLT
ncbi:NADPH:quinone oxidoreductase family protein [Tardiphaga alba]|uniref:NADPH:quinone oxidoreductase family protein n=1 Tax=Tardiphaga alba TaxID=340268 RepID=A0ABX8ADW7_9BRAD|nr:NADPH:quinone oxidoreductase family protein [Tardiphaga alba]QUS41948.1 NADPH:quinone oxidoreductase family protein [Tardiphaga alba]